MTHETTYMAVMETSSKGLGLLVSRVENAM
jgi:hypothetical protein